MQYTENYEKNFADDGDRAPINDELWEGGWREIVGGVNGYPTSAQFNEVCGRPDRKANELKKNKIDLDGDAKDLKTTFSQASKRENIESGEKISKSLGKIAKWFSDFGGGAWADIANDDKTTEAGKVADARIVKKHGDEIDQLRQDIDEVSQSFQDGCNTIVAGCTSYGSTPDSNSPEDIVEAIGEIYNNRYTQGYNAGHTAGYSEGYSEGHDAGYSEGYAAGDSAGYNRGYSEGQSAGYNQGYTQGQADFKPVVLNGTLEFESDGKSTWVQGSVTIPAGLDYVCAGITSTEDITGYDDRAEWKMWTVSTNWSYYSDSGNVNFSVGLGGGLYLGAHPKINYQIMYIPKT